MARDLNAHAARLPAEGRTALDIAGRLQVSLSSLKKVPQRLKGGEDVLSVATRHRRSFYDILVDSVWDIVDEEPDTSIT